MLNRRPLAAAAVQLTVLVALAAPAGAQQCPTQSVVSMQALCQQEYGALVTLCYPPANQWWFVELVTQGASSCQPGGIDQTMNPFQSSGQCIGDQVLNDNGPPAAVAPCTDVTNQVIFAGPSQQTVAMCQYPNVQTIRVTGRNGTPADAVITSVNVPSVACAYD